MPETILSADAAPTDRRAVTGAGARPTYRCPACADPLGEDPTGFTCGQGHRYDRAKDGYVNLLPGGRLKGGPAGDDDAMVRARRTVFNAGLYAPIIDAVAATVVRLGTSTEHGPLRLLDCGSGEGAYLAAAAARSGADAWGIDISKAAARLAARRHRSHHFAVASAYRAPFADRSFDVAMSVFSPRPFEEMMRVLDVHGKAIVVRPGPDHLGELKALLYDEPRRHRDPAAGDEGGGADWPVAAEEIAVVSFDLTLDDPTLRLALLAMTPYWWSARPEQHATMAGSVLAVHVDVRISVFGHAD